MTAMETRFECLRKLAGVPASGPASACFCLAAVGGLLLLTGDVHSWKRLRHRWVDSAIPVSMILNVGSGWNGTARDALGVWNGAGSNFRFTSETSSGSERVTCSSSSIDRRNVVVWGAGICGESFGDRTLAITKTWSYTSSGEAVDSDVVFNTAFSWSTYGGPLRDSPDFRRVAIHEFGHVLGLAHPDDHGQTVTAIMNAHISDLDTIQADDVNGVIGIYGRGANRAPGATGSVPAQTLTAGGGPASVNVAPYFTDPDGDALTYTAVSSRTGVVRAAVAESTVTLTPVAAGTATVTVTARDPGGLSATQSIAVTVVASGGGGFTDDPLVPGVTPVRAVHFRELRARVDALRARAGLSAFAWTDSSLTPGVTPVRSVHVTELRNALDAAYAAAGQPAPGYADASLTPGATPIRAGHISELRAAVVELENAGPGGGNRAPRATGSIPAQTLTVGGGSATVGVARYFTDPDGDRLTYTANSNRTTVVMAGAAGSTVTLRPVAAGTATVTVTARDPGGLSATQSIAVTVETSGPALVGEITECSGTPGTLFIDVVIAGRVTARRTVSRLLTPIRGYVDGTYVGFQFLPAMSAGQTEGFRITGFILNAGQSTITCRIEIG